MRVVQINSVATGSTGTIAKKLSLAMTQAGIENRIFYGIGSSDFVDAQKFGDTLSLRLHQLSTRLFDRHGTASMIPTKKMIEALKAFQPDIVHLHNMHGFYLHIPLLFSYLKEHHIPILWTMHDCWAFTGHCAHFQQLSCEKYKTECRNCPGLSAYPRSWFIDRSQKNFREKRAWFSNVENLHIAAPSVWLQKKLSESFLKDYPVHVIHNGISLSSFSAKEIEKPESLRGKRIYLGIAAKWIPEKGYPDFLAMAKKLRSDELLLLVGDGEADAPDNILRYPRTSTAEELIDLYRMADVFLNPTHCDTFPTVNMEALACGTPVVTYDVGGSAEIPDVHSGAAVPVGDIDGLLFHARRLAACPDNQEHCLQRAAIFSEENQISSYLRLYQEIGAIKA